MIIMPVSSWTNFKSLIAAKMLQIQYAETSQAYELYASEASTFIWNMSLPKDGGADVTDFETNYKPTANAPQTVQSTIQSAPSFTAKVLPNGKKLYVRNTGIQAALSIGSNDITYTTTYTWAKLVGAEVVNGEALDYIDFKVYDTAAGTYSGTPNALLNQFGFSVNISPGFYTRSAPYDADLYAGIVLKMTYHSVSAKTIGINLLLNEVK